MDIFAYVSLSVFGLLFLVWGSYFLVSVLKEPFLRAIFAMATLYAVVFCAAISAVWIIGTKVI